MAYSNHGKWHVWNVWLNCVHNLFNSPVSPECSRVIGLRGMSSRPHHPGSYNTPLVSSVQESYVQDCGAGVEVSFNGTAPGYLSELCVPVVSASGRQHLRSASTGLLQVPRAWIMIGRRSFAVTVPSLWNSLPAALQRPEMTLHTFKRQLKAHLFYIWCAGEQNERLPPLLRRFRNFEARYKTAYLLTYLHIQLNL